MLSAKDIAVREKAKHDAKKEMYRAMLSQFCRKIRASYELGHKDATVTVPPFIVGFPKYDMARAVMYMARQLQRLGYTVNMVGPFSLKVQWGRAPPDEPTEELFGEAPPMDILPALVNLQKTAQKLRITKKT